MPSSVIRSFRYRPSARELEVEFVSGRRYRYMDVPSGIALAMQAAGSKGSYFNRHIRGHFAFAALSSAPDR
jgi:hypothetical protein